jgi:hypothetical protein
MKFVSGDILQTGFGSMLVVSDRRLYRLHDSTFHKYKIMRTGDILPGVMIRITELGVIWCSVIRNGQLYETGNVG